MVSGMLGKASVSISPSNGNLDANRFFYPFLFLMYAFANNVLESVRIPELKTRINKLIANKLGVRLGFDL